MRMRIGLCGVMVSLLAVGPATHAQRPTARSQKPLVLRGALLIDGSGGAPVPNSVIVLAGDKIQAVGSQGSVSVPADATLIDATGKTIIPGLVDSHVHYRNFLAPFFLYWGVTTVGDMGNTQGWILSEKRAVEKGLIQGPFIMAVGRFLTMPTPQGEPRNTAERNGYDPGQWMYGNETWVYVNTDAEIEAVIAGAKKLGIDGIKLYTRLPPDKMKKAAEIGHHYGFPVFAHYTGGTARGGNFLGTDEILDTGIDGHLHLFGLIKSTAPLDVRQRIEKGENVRAWHLLDTSKFPGLAQKLVDKKMYLNPTFIGSQIATPGSKHLAEFEEANTAFMQGPMGKLIPPESLPNYLRAFKPAQGQAAEEAKEGFRRAGVFVKEFSDRGGKVIAGGDEGSNIFIAGLTMHFELQLLQEAGLSPMQAIQAATSWGMEAWGKSSIAGTIAAGKRADLVILNRNPLDDISATRDISQVIQAGKVVDRAALANWKDSLPRPTPDQTGPANTLFHIPFINEVSPEMLIANSATTEVTIRGDRFTPDCFVLFNDQVVPVKFQDEHRITASIRLKPAPAMGSYSIVVVRPGSGGGVSNANYIVVTP